MGSRFRILGPIEVEGGAPRGRPLWLLALLIVDRGVVSVDRIADELWEGAGPRHKRKAVHVVASRLRSALGDDAVRSEGAGYALRAAPGELDADRFAALVRRGRTELAAGDAREAAATLAQALGLWRGPALADVAEARFAQPEIARLEELRLACVSDRIDADLACGRHEELVGELDGLVRAHPLRERLRGQQMLALYRSGRQAEALDAYRSAYEALADGLGIEPSPELRALEAAILRQEVPAPAQAPPRESLAVDERRLVTCVFARLGRAAVDAESLRAVGERLHEVCAGAWLAETRADAILAVFGGHEDDAQRALRAAADLAKQALPFELRARCGVATGEVVAAAGTVVGQAVGTAERLAREGAGGEVRIDARTWRTVRHAASATQVDDAFLLVAIDAAAPAIRRRLDRPLVGREAELAQLHAAFERVTRERRAELLAIVGEPGIGKSRLAAELGSIIGRVPAHGQGITYWPLRELVERAKGDRSLDVMASELGISPAAAHQAAAAVGLREAKAGEDTGWAFMQLIGALAREAPLALAIDDAHLAEPALLDLLADVAARLDAPALILWIARRDQFAHRLPEAVLEVGPLSADASAALLEAIAGGRLDADERRRIAVAAGGNPLFLEQLVAYVGERDTSPELPPALHSLLAARLDGLDAAERSALALGAVVGEAFDVDAVHALAEDVTRAELEQACERLVDRDLLHVGSPVRFRHGLVREVAYASLAKSARARLHERHAEWLAGRGDDLPEADARIGLHLETRRPLRARARRRRRAARPGRGRRLAAAGRIARVRGDLPGEIGFLDRAVALLGTDREEGAALLPALVSALIEAGASSRAEVLALTAVAASAALELPGLQARAAIERERVRLHRHPDSFDVAAAVAVVDRASLALRGDELGLARAGFLMADLTWLTGDLVASYAHAEQMLAHARRADSGFDVATALVFMAWCLVEGPCPVPDAIARYDALETDAAGLRAAELTLTGCRAVLHTLRGAYGEASGVMAEVREGLAELQLSGIALYFALLTGVAASHAGDHVAAERAARDAHALVSDPGDHWYLAMIQLDLAQALLGQERLADAEAAVDGIDAWPAPCDADLVIRRHTARARLARLRGQPESGLDEARAAVAVGERTDLMLSRANAQRTLAELLTATGETEAAASALREALALYEAKGNLAALAATRRMFAVKAS